MGFFERSYLYLYQVLLPGFECCPTFRMRRLGSENCVRRLTKLVEVFFGEQTNYFALEVVVCKNASCDFAHAGAMQDVIWVAMLVLIMLYIFGVIVTSLFADRKEVG